uniref:Uncharacterized protein n=1 Tax=Myoviridae sp. ctCo31 TaxID=2825053 RepID=A0A8S5UMU7_9CAUD|nr:MAG TPA: hypothetical protein [Myoviridae sp. ctCo31]
MILLTFITKSIDWILNVIIKLGVIAFMILGILYLTQVI